MFQKRPFLHFVWATHQLRAVQGNTFVLWPFPKACYSSHKRLPTFLLFINDFKNDVIESIPAAGEIKACLGKAW